MKLNNRRWMIFASALAFASLSLSNCSYLEEEDNDSETLGLLALALAGGNSVAIQQNTQAIAAESAVNSAIQSAQQSGDIALLDSMDMLPENFDASTINHKSSIIPTAITVDSGSCTGTYPNQTCNTVISGSGSCINGGTVSFSGFTYSSTTTGAGSTSFNFDGTSSGTVTFNSCGITYASILDGKNDSVVLSGSITLNATGTGGFSFNSPTTTYTRNGTTTITNSGDFTIDGAAVAWTEGVSEQNYSNTLTVISASPLRGSTSLTGTFKWNGATIATFVNEVRTFSCSGTGADMVCTLE